MKPSLSQKVLIIIALLFGIQSAYLYFSGENLLESVLLESSKKQALTFLRGLRQQINATATLDSEQLQAHIEQALDNFEETDFSIYRLYVFDRQGRLLADSFGKTGTNKDISKYFTRIFEQGRPWVGQDIEYKPLNGQQVAIADLIIPLARNGDVIAALEVEVNLQNTLALIRTLDNKHERDITLFIIVNGLLFMAALWYFLRREVLAPIESIDRTAQAVASGKLDARVHIDGSNEIHHLAESVNSMAANLQDLLDQQEQAHIQVLQSLAKALEAKDPYTAGHSGRVAKYAVKLGKHLGLNNEQLAVLKKGALMHDLGKIAIPDAILNKPAPLTEEESLIMRTHPEKTAVIMRPLRHYREHREIAAWHHERWDGKGYPDGLKGEQIPLLARIVAIADSWDAMTGDRIYRKGMSTEQALAILARERDSGQWDPELVSAFIEMMSHSTTG